MSRSLLAIAATCFLLLATAARADVPYWQYRYGFAPYARTIAVDPTNPDIVYVGASNAGTPLGEYTAGGTGIFRSTDGGASFTPRNNGMGNYLTTAIVVDPTTPTTIYAGVLDEGVFKSTNSGISWSPVNTGITSLSILSLAIDPTTQTIFAGTSGITGGGLFRSLDGGATWTRATGTTGVSVYAIAIDPTNTSIVYAGGFGVQKSVDGGASFALSGPFQGAEYQYANVRGLAIDASDPTRLVAAVYGFDSGMWRSLDAGATWQVQNMGLFVALGPSGSFNFTNHMVSVAQDPLVPNTFYASGVHGFYRSVDGGATWANFASGLSREQCPAIATHPDGTIFTGSVFGELHRLRVRPSGVNHFRCFKAKGSSFAPQSVTLDDEYGVTTTTALKPVRYCTPTDPMGEGVVDPTSHLVCYKTAKYPFEKQEFIGFMSQRIDGYRGYSLDRGDTLCVPATVGVPAAAPRDAYRCLDGPNWWSQGIEFIISDAYGSQLIRKHKNERFCTPTGVNGEARIEEGVKLRCDSMKGTTDFTRTTVTTTDRFGTQTLRLVKPETHCFQALESRL